MARQGNVPWSVPLPLGGSFGYERSLSSFKMAGQIEIRRGGNDKGT
jgi:hypothetical protein